MFNILTISWAHAHYMFDWSNRMSVSFSLLFCLMLGVLFIALPIMASGYDKNCHINHKLGIYAVLVFLVGVLLCAFSFRNIFYNGHYDTNYDVANAQHQMHHIKEIYPSLPCHKTDVLHVCSNSVTHDIHKVHQYNHTHQLTKPIARQKYEHYHNIYKREKSDVKLPLGVHVHNKFKLYNLHWWNAI